MPNKPYYTLGLDLGKWTDPAALAVLESDSSTTVLRLVGLKRFPLGTAYTEILHVLEQRLESAPLAGRVRLAVDASGVGAPFVDQFRQQLPAIEMYAITITAGSNVHGDRRNPHVPKQDLIATTALILETGRLRIATEMRETPTLIDELLSYQYTRNERGYDTYDASAGQHDDLVIALSLALWLTRNQRIRNRSQRASWVDRGVIPGVGDMNDDFLY